MKGRKERGREGKRRGRKVKEDGEKEEGVKREKREEDHSLTECSIWGTG